MIDALISGIMMANLSTSGLIRLSNILLAITVFVINDVLNIFSFYFSTTGTPNRTAEGKEVERYNVPVKNGR